MNPLKAEFGKDFASTAFQVVDGEPRIVGKFGNIALIDGIYDIWLVQPDLGPLTEHKLTAISKKWPAREGFLRLSGEGMAQTPSSEIIRQIAPILGVRKRRKLSSEARAELRDRVKKIRRST